MGNGNIRQDGEGVERDEQGNSIEDWARFEADMRAEADAENAWWANEANVLGDCLDHTHDWLGQLPDDAALQGIGRLLTDHGIERVLAVVAMPVLIEGKVVEVKVALCQYDGWYVEEAEY
jgi:hypothetical protein